MAEAIGGEELRSLWLLDKLLCLDGEAMSATLTSDSDIRYIAQVGFSSNLDPGTFKRAPLHLVAVIDGSDSMSGQPLELVKESLMTVVSQLNPDDALSVVLYSDHSHVYMDPTPVRDEAANRALTLSNERADHEGAHQAVHALASTYRQTSDLDPDLAEERTTLFTLERTLAKRTGPQDDPTVKAGLAVDRVTGLPSR